ncbi:MAG TPA: hypothetical protein VKZ93_05730 [Arenibacter sp.]|nr:hypothetical protein [Arenibacter sp.]
MDIKLYGDSLHGIMAEWGTLFKKQQKIVFLMAVWHQYNIEMPIFATKIRCNRRWKKRLLKRENTVILN